MTNQVGLIYPPFELRTTIDKTASFVAKNGEAFESRILSESGSIKFTFLNKDNPFHLYYKKRLEDFKNGISIDDGGPTIPRAILDMNSRKEKQEVAEKEVLMLTSFCGNFGFMGGAVMEPEEPRKDQYTVSHPMISIKDESVIKITAMYLSRNGQSFLSELTSREANNPQFDFLKPGHALFGYFADLVETYSLCLIPNKNYLMQMKKEAEDLQMIFRRCYKNSLWRKKEIDSNSDLLELENKDHIDLEWVAINIVETVDFEDICTDLPEPVDFSTLSKVVLESSLDTLNEHDRKDLLEDEIQSEERQINVLVVEKERANDMEVSNEVNNGKNDDASEQEEFKNIKIIKNYVRVPKKRGYATKAEEQSLKGKMYRCPITGQSIPVEEISNHMRILLLDPKWKQQKDQLIQRAQQDSAFTASSNIEENLAAFVSKRPDLFGTIEEAVAGSHGFEDTGGKNKKQKFQ
ncbi:pre-mRNA splicing factor domain-containing protein [Cryptosporidium ubiquitum]|uniref:Pre-mRNA splicing factor domain-containing protein n=1 Tax=Cryptosporidium ubiquitum TaxID=857276 RepID=A0A1J4MIK2_9CRYT|nr:pre-mRNA splicing factor domain-containing protein [Cryptosporidium ubiquitum]OII74090.1 pre-mRNA splicing factor domain-containing protein [Cryptosporidium ubiquitum]